MSNSMLVIGHWGLGFCRYPVQSPAMSAVLHNPRLRLHIQQASKFIFCGLTGAAIEFSILKVIVGHYGVSPFVAFVPSSLIPATFVFFFNKYVTFRVGGETTSRQTKRFITVYATALVINYMLSSSFYALGMKTIFGGAALGIELNRVRVAYIAKAVAIGITAIYNYCFSHWFIFKKEEVPAEVEGAVF